MDTEIAPLHIADETDFQWAYRVWGQPSDRSPIVFLHGLGDHSLVWQSVAATLADQGQHCIALDLPGHGHSTKPEDPSAYAAPRLAQQVAQAVGQQVGQQVEQQRQQPAATADRLHKVPQPFTVVAHSWAAKVALLWAQQQPHQVGQVILVDPFFVNRFPRGLRITVPLLYRTLPFLKVMGPFADWETAIALAQTLKQYRGWSPLQQAVFDAAMVQTETGAWVSRFTPAARDGIFADTFATDGLVQTVATPSLLILPEAGLNRSPLQTRPYRRHLSHLTLQSVPGNHWPHLVAPEALTAAIVPHLSANG